MNRIRKLSLLILALAALCCGAPGHGLAATIKVNSAIDGTLAALSGNGTCDLREAITAANSNSNVAECSGAQVTGAYGTDKIVFDIPGAGPHLIEVNSTLGGELPIIDSALTIDGYSQPGSAVGIYPGGEITADIRVGIKRTAGSAGWGLRFAGPGATGTVQGLRITGFNSYGIFIQSGAHDINIFGNFIGTDGANALGNAYGVYIADATFIKIGIASPAARNIIAGNTAGEVRIVGPTTSGIEVRRNLIGTRADGDTRLAAPGSMGISVFDGANFITMTGNIIGAGDTGVRLDSGVTQVTIGDGTGSGINMIGVGGLGGNIGGTQHGVWVNDHIGAATTNSSIDTNIVANWGGDGVRIQKSTALATPAGIRISATSIYNNGGLGINLTDTLNGVNTGVDANDAGDADTGPNGFQNYPVITSASSNGVVSNIAFTLSAKPNTNYRLDYFASPACDASGNGEGQRYRGTTQVTTNGAGSAAANVASVPIDTAGEFLTMTATDIATGDTSEFSACYFIAGTLDVDASISASKYDALTDGLLVIRYLFGLTGKSLTNGALGGTALRTDPSAIKSYLDGARPVLDVDGNGQADALTDGLMVLRYLFGLKGQSLIVGAIGAGATRTTAGPIETYIQSLMP